MALYTEQIGRNNTDAPPHAGGHPALPFDDGGVR